MVDETTRYGACADRPTHPHLFAPGDPALSSSTPRVDYQTHPSQYKHWRLDFEGAVATLAADVDETVRRSAIEALKQRSELA